MAAGRKEQWHLQSRAFLFLALQLRCMVCYLSRAWEQGWDDLREGSSKSRNHYHTWRVQSKVLRQRWLQKKLGEKGAARELWRLQGRRPRTLDRRRETLWCLAKWGDAAGASRGLLDISLCRLGVYRTVQIEWGIHQVGNAPAHRYRQRAHISFHQGTQHHTLLQTCWAVLLPLVRHSSTLGEVGIPTHGQRDALAEPAHRL